MLQKNINIESSAREKRIIKRLNLKNLPFETSLEEFCSKYIEMISDLKESFILGSDKPGMQWCLSTIKKFKVFLLYLKQMNLELRSIKKVYPVNYPNTPTKQLPKLLMKDWKKDFLLKCQHVSKKNMI